MSFSTLSPTSLCAVTGPKTTARGSGEKLWSNFLTFTSLHFETDGALPVNEICVSKSFFFAANGLNVTVLECAMEESTLRNILVWCWNIGIIYYLLYNTVTICLLGQSPSFDSTIFCLIQLFSQTRSPFLLLAFLTISYRPLMPWKCPYLGISTS